MRLFVCLFVLFCIRTESKIVPYYLHESNNSPINECIIKAMELIMKETCLVFEKNRQHEDSILFLESGHCSWQSGNSTVHLGANCANEDTCVQVISRALSTDRPYPFIPRLLNLKFNCTDKCTVPCENGGRVTESCTCECGYGFEGKHCEKLSMSTQFTDTSCGIVHGDESGTINLSTFPKTAPAGTFCQWLIKASQPWETIEIEFAEMDLDNDNIPPTQKCNDNLIVLGVDQLKQPIPCNKEYENIRSRRYRSKENWLLVELRTNPWTRRPHTGPVINYEIISPANSNAINTFSAEQIGNTACCPLLSTLGLLAWSFILFR